MSSFDPATVRKAVEEFTPRRPQKFQDLLPARDVITELRQKRASYRSIADLLTQHCLPTSKTAIAVFCHQVLGEGVRPRKRPARKRPSVSTPANGEPTTPETALASEGGTAVESVTNHDSNEAPQTRSRGPRIAQVRMLKPQST
jgi:formylglycine-generating enzyme required for sulfatase activity